MSIVLHDTLFHLNTHPVGIQLEPRTPFPKNDSDGPQDNSAQLKIVFSYFSTKTYVVGAQKNHLNETKNTCLN